MELRRALFTSNSKDEVRRSRGALKAVVAFALTFALCIVAGNIAGRRLPFLHAWFGDEDAPVLDDGRSYLAYIQGNTLDHVILYRDFGQSMDFARRADVLLLGNSRINLGFPHEVLERVAASADVRVFNLGMGYDESFRYPLDIIRRYDLRPRAVVVNADSVFFSSGSSHVASRLLSDRELTRDVWQDYKNVVETTLGFRAARILHRFIPRFCIAKSRSSLVFFRSYATGSWQWAAGPAVTKRVPITELTDGNEQLSDAEIQNALAFQREMQTRRTAIILTQVPYNKSSDQKLRQLAQLLDVPVIRPQLDNLATFDGSHLTAESAARFSTAFFDDFFSNSRIVAALPDKSQGDVAAEQRETIRAIHRTGSGSKEIPHTSRTATKAGLLVK